MAKARVWSMLLALAMAIPAALPSFPALAAEKAEAPTDRRLIAAAGLFQRGLYKLAAQEYEEFLRQNANHADAANARYALGLCRYRLGEHSSAAQAIREALRAEKLDQRDEALAVLGHCFLATKEHDKALGAFEELLKNHADSKHAESAAASRVQVLYTLGKHKETAAAAGEFLGKYGQSAQRGAVAYFMGLAHSGLGEHAKVVEALREVAEKSDSPYRTDALLLSGQALEAQGKLDEAIERYKQMVKSAPAARRGDARFSLGLALHKAGKYEQAVEELTLMLADEESAKGAYAAPARLQLGLSQLAGARYADARKTLRLVVERDEQRANAARYALAQCDIAERKYADALKLLEELARGEPNGPNAPQVAFQQGLCLMGLEKFDEAVASFDRFRQKYPKDAQAGEAVYRQAFCLHKLGKYAESHSLCEKAAASKVPHALRTPLAELDAENLFLLKKYAEAEKAFASLAEGADGEPRRLRMALRQGQSVYFAADYPRAARLLEVVASNPAAMGDPLLVESAFLMGDALLQAGKHAEAAAALEKYLAATKKKNPEAQFKLALAQARAGENDAAERTLGQLIDSSSDPAWTQRGLLELAQLQVKSGKPEKAVTPLKKLLESSAPAELAGPATYLLGWIDFNAKRYAEAAGRFGEVVEKYPKDALAADAAFQRGVALKEAGKGDEAVAALEQFISAHGKSERIAQARQLIASIQVRQDKPADAAKTLAALAADPKTVSAPVLYDLAWAQRGLKDENAAADAYRRLLRDFAKEELATAAAVELADLLYNQGKFADAVPLLQQAIDAKADGKLHAAARYRLGLCHSKLNEPSKAASAFAAFTEHHKDDPLAASAHYQAGEAYASQGRHSDAEKHFSAVVKRFGGHELAPVARLKLGEVQNDAGSHEAAEATFKEYLSAHAKDKFAHLAQFGIGWSLESRQKFEEARQWYAKVTAAHNGPTAARAQFQTGQTFMKEKKYEEAVRALLAVEDVYASPDWSPPALYDAGQALEQLNQRDQAKQQYEQVVKKYKESKVAELAGKRLAALGQ